MVVKMKRETRRERLGRSVVRGGRASGDGKANSIQRRTLEQGSGVGVCFQGRCQIKAVQSTWPVEHAPAQHRPSPFFFLLDKSPPFSL